MFLGPKTMPTLVAASYSPGTKLHCWRAKGALGQEQQNADILLNACVLCLSCPTTTCALHHGGFVPRGWLAA